ncbi:hypothetical protein Hanom_Chr03g00213271 [Helianthus anomalus]
MRHTSDTAATHHPLVPHSSAADTHSSPLSLSPAKIDGWTPASHGEADNSSEPWPTVVQLSGPDTLSIPPVNRPTTTIFWWWRTTAATPPPRAAALWWVVPVKTSKKEEDRSLGPAVGASDRRSETRTGGRSQGPSVFAIIRWIHDDKDGGGAISGQWFNLGSFSVRSSLFRFSSSGSRFGSVMSDSGFQVRD